MKFRKSDYKLLFICVLLIIICIILYKFTNNDESIIEQSSKTNDLVLLKDYSRFYTINSCVYKYILSIQNNSTDDLLKLLNEDYKKNNNIDSNNIYKYIENINGNYSFRTKKVYYINISNYLIKYYVYGNLIEDTIDSYNNDETDYYVIINMDIKNKLFDVIPYDGSVFKEANNE